MSRKPSFPSQRCPGVDRRRGRTAVAAAVIVLAAAACEPVTPPLGGGDSAPAAADAEAPAGPAEQTPAAEPASAETATPPPRDLPALAMSPDVRGGDIVPGPERAPGPRTLVGLEHHQVKALLGEPSFKRRDDPAQIWQYRDSTCILDVFLYRPDVGGAYRVVHVEVRGRSVIRVSHEDCFLSLLETRSRDDAG